MQIDSGHSFTQIELTVCHAIILFGDSFANETFGDQGSSYFVRMILPPNSLSNVLTVRCTLDAVPAATARQHLTIVAVHDSLWTMQYAPPAELPVETKVSPIT